MIDYLVPDFFIEADLGVSGGMHTKVDRVRRAVGSTYRLHVGSDLSAMRSDFLLIEPLYFRMMGFDDLDALRHHDATKILYCSEFEPFRWAGGFRKELLNICDAVTCNSDYQFNLLRSVGVLKPHRLIDPIPETEFMPLPKKLQVVGVGKISEIKGSGLIAELFEALCPTPIETMFVGGAALWGEACTEDMKIESRIRKSADIFYQNVRFDYVPKAIGAASFFVGNSIHDVFSSSHAEALMSGCVSIGGAHPIYAERPGFSGFETALDMVNRISQVTKGFTALPVPDLKASARAWAEANVSFSTFQRQLTGILKEFYE